MSLKYRHRHGLLYQYGSRERTLFTRDSNFLAHLSSVYRDSAQMYAKLHTRKRMTKNPSNGHNLNKIFQKKNLHKNSITRKKKFFCINEKPKSFWISGSFWCSNSSNELKDVELVKRYIKRDIRIIVGNGM